MNRFHKNASIPVLLSLSVLSGCSMVPPEEPQHQSMLTNEQIQLKNHDIQAIHRQWWNQFGDQQLAQLIQLGLTNNLTLQQAKQRIDLASQQVALAESGDKPKLNLNVSGGGIGANTQSFNTSNADYSAIGMLLPSFSYQFDFWGKNEATVAAASDQKLSLEAQEAQARLVISASIASSYFALQNSYRLERNLTTLLDEINHQNYVITAQVKRGLASEAESFQNQGDIDTLSAQLSDAKTQQQLAKNQLALYLAKTPDQLGQLTLPNAQAINQLAAVDTIPMNLLGRRPDIIASKWMVEANEQGIKQAKASYYPDVNLMVMGVFQKLSNINPASLFLGGATVAASLPLYDGGVRDANYASANIHFDQAVTNYNQTVLNAVKQTSDAIVSLQEAQKQQVLAQSSVMHYQHAYEILNNRYERGLSSFADMNSARMQWHQQVIKLTNSESAILQNQLQLIVALGGDYQQEQPVLASTPSNNE
jgi:NodT family efflux transporter outer membrane factor (OMF) lipoprotein